MQLLHKSTVRHMQLTPCTMCQQCSWLRCAQHKSERLPRPLSRALLYQVARHPLLLVVALHCTLQMSLLDTKCNKHSYAYTSTSARTVAFLAQQLLWAALNPSTSPMRLLPQHTWPQLYMHTHNSSHWLRSATG